MIRYFLTEYEVELHENIRSMSSTGFELRQRAIDQLIVQWSDHAYDGYKAWLTRLRYKPYAGRIDSGPHSASISSSDD